MLPENVQIKDLDSFKVTSLYTFDRHAPIKEKHVRCNQGIIIRSRLLNKFRQEKTISSHAAYKSSERSVLSYYEKLNMIFSIILMLIVEQTETILENRETKPK